MRALDYSEVCVGVFCLVMSFDLAKNQNEYSVSTSEEFAVESGGCRGLGGDCGV